MSHIHHIRYSKTSSPSSSQGEGKLSFFNNMVGIFESEVDVADNFSEKYGSGNRYYLHLQDEEKSNGRLKIIE